MHPEKRLAKENAEALETLFSQRFLQMAALRANAAPKAMALQNAIAVYCRRSNEAENLSIDRQIKRANDYARDRLNSVVAYVYSDEGISGETASRPGLNEMMADARAGRFNALILEDIDRVGRRFGVIGNTYDELVDLGIKIHSVIKGDAVGNVDVALKGLAATEFQVNLRARSRDGREMAFNAGRIVSNMPFGYVRDPYRRGQYQIDENLKPHIEWMFKARLNGMTIPNIVAGLKERVPDPKIIPNTKFAIGRALTNPIYKGVYTYGRYDRTLKARGKARRQRPTSEWYLKYHRHLQIVSNQDGEDVNKTFRTGRKQMATRLLSLKAVCTWCGRILAVQTGPDTKPFYRCYRTGGDWQQEANKCVPRGTTAVSLEGLVLSAIRRVLDDPSLEDAYRTMLEAEIQVQRSTIARRRRALEQRSAEQREEIKNYMRAFAKSGAFGDELVEEEVRELRENWAQTKAKIAALPYLGSGPVVGPSRRASLLEVFDRASTRVFLPEHELTIEEKEERGVLRSLIAGVHVTPIRGSRTVKVTVDISTPGLLGCPLPDGGTVPAVTSFTYRLHEGLWFWRDDIAEAYRSREFVLADTEWDAVSRHFANRLAGLSFEQSQVRELLDLAAFVSATSTKRFHVGKLDLPRKSPLPDALGRVICVGLWDQIRLFLESNFPSRRGVFNPEIASVYQTSYDPKQQQEL